MEQPEVSVIVVYYNARDFVLPAVRSAHASAGSVPHEVVVVDNASPEPLPEELKEEYDWLRIVRATTNEGYAAGCNRGWRASSGPFLLFLNPDTEIRGETIPNLVGFLKGNPKVGVVSCRIVNTNGEIEPHLFEFPSPWWSMAYTLAALPARWPQIRRWLGRWFIRYHDPYESCAADWMIGCAVMVRREALEKIGGWDESYFLYAEEIDLYCRLRRAGWEACYVANGEIVHHGGMSSEPGAGEGLLQSYRSRYRFIERSMGSGRAWLYRLITAAKQLLGSAADGFLWVLGRGERSRRIRSLRFRWKLILVSLKISS